MSSRGPTISQGQEFLGSVGFYLLPGQTGRFWQPIDLDNDGRGAKAVSQMDMSETHSCAIVAGGELVCWGSNVGGAIG